jgi:hypothetical protein
MTAEGVCDGAGGYGFGGDPRAALQARRYSVGKLETRLAAAA